MRNSGCFSLTRHCNTMNIMRSNDGLMKIVYMTCIYTRMYIYVYIYIYIDVFMHIMCLNWICHSFQSLQVTVMAVTHHYYRDIGFPLHTFAHHRGAHVRLKQGNLEGTTIILCPRGLTFHDGHGSIFNHWRLKPRWRDEFRDDVKDVDVV